MDDNIIERFYQQIIDKSSLNKDDTINILTVLENKILMYLNQGQLIYHENYGFLFSDNEVNINE